jgi:hypothetical protein
MCRSHWFVPLFALGLGSVVFGAQAIAGHPGSGLVSLGIMAFAGIVVIIAIIVGFIVELAHGRNGNPYSWLGALGGVAYQAAILAMRLRG